MLKQNLPKDLVGLDEFLATYVRPEVLRWDEANKFPEHIFRQFHEKGWLNSHLLPASSPQASNTVRLLEIAYLLGYYAPGIFTSFIANVLGTTAVQRFMPEPLKSYVLSQALGQFGLFAFAMTENGAGIDVESNVTTAVKRGDHYILNGEKNFVTGTNYACHFLVFARDVESADGFSVFYVDGDRPGLKRSAPYKKLGHRESNTGTLILKDVGIPLENKLDTPKGGLEVLLACVSRTKTLISGACAGLMEAASSEVIEHLQQRVKREKSLLSRPDIKALLAIGYTHAEAAWALALKAAETWDARGIAVVESSCAKLFSANAAVEFSSEAIELCGAQGYLEDSFIAKIYRDAKAFEIYEGASTVQMNLVSKAILSGYVEPHPKVQRPKLRIVG